MPAAIASTAMTTTGIVKSINCVRPVRISQIANKIDPQLFVNLRLLTSGYAKCGLYCPVSRVTSDATNSGHRSP